MTLRIRNLSKSYQGIPVFSHVNLTLEQGGTYCLMAPSGAGKTTLLRILMGLELPDTGSIEGLQGLRTAAVFQEDRLCPALTAAENIRLVDPCCSGSALSRELLALLPADSLSRPVSAYSGGMCRRVSLLRAMLSKGRLLLFDEPFNGLDAQSRQDAIRYIREKKGDRTLLFTTHHMEEALALSAICFLWDADGLTWYPSAFSSSS